MSFWKKKQEDRAYLMLLKKYELVEAMLKVLEKDVEIINIKLRKRVYREPHDDEKESKERIDAAIDDGFNELRRLNKQFPA